MHDSLKSLRNSLLAAVAAAGLISVCTPAQAQDDPPPQAGRISLLFGTVSIQPAGGSDWGQAFPNYPVGPGDRIFTDFDGRAEIQVGQTFIRIGPNSDVTLVDDSPDGISIGVGQGAIRVHSNGLWQDQALYVQTPSGTATAQGPSDMRVEVMPDDLTAIVTDNYGDLYLSGAGEFGLAEQQGQSIELIGTNPVYPEWLEPADPDDLDQWSMRRDQQIQNAMSFRYVSAEVPGAYELDQYGQWMPGTEYGNIWFPSVAVGWSPYHYGHWVNHEPWGSVWVEDEPWGYAPFHYGRWVNYQGRWGWLPGSPAEHPVWSPALVAFAGGIQIGGGISVWFPLGPGEPYRPWYPCSPRYIDRVNISNMQESRSVHIQTTYVNIVNVNVTNITYVNRTIGVTAMRQEDFAAGRPVAQVAVHVDPQQMAHVQVLARPQVQVVRQAAISHPPARPVRVQAARPVLINAKGMAVAAQPKAAPAPPPVKQAPAPRALPNHRIVAAPANVKMTPAARQAVQARPPANRPPAPAPTNAPSQAHPVAAPASPAQHNQPMPPAQVNPKPAPAPEAHPLAQPEKAPAERPEPTPPARPAPSQETRPVAHPPVEPAEKPAPHPVAPPPTKPEEKPPVHAAPPPPQQHPEARPAPAEKPAPADKNKKPAKDDKKKPNKDEEKKPE